MLQHKKRRKRKNSNVQAVLVMVISLIQPHAGNSINVLMDSLMRIVVPRDYTSMTLINTVHSKMKLDAVH